MNLEKNTFKKIPVLAAIILTFAGLGAGIYLINQGQILFSKATSGSSPQQIKITNIDSNMFAVSWITENSSSGRIVYGENSSLKETKNDIKDEGLATPKAYLTHFVLMDNLRPKTKYYFKIVSENKSYGQADKPFEVTTAVEKPFPGNDIAQGKILTPAGEPASDTIVYYTLPNTITQASPVEENGYFMILLSRARTNDLQNYSDYDQTAQIGEIFVQAGRQTATATLTTGNDNPVPDIVLGQNYDFVNPPSAPTPTLAIQSNVFPTNAPEFSGFQAMGQDENVVIIYPSEKETVNSQIPEFLGTGPKEKILNITVESEKKISDETKVNNNGQWKWSPEEPLAPGNHQITISYLDQDGFSKTVSRNFVVLAAGTSDLPSFTATPSGQISPTVKLSPSPTVLPTKSTLSPTPTDKAVRTTLPSGPVPKSGNDLPTWIFLGGGTMMIVVGIAFLLL